MQVYAVVYADSGAFLLGLKLKKGYFFHKTSGGGVIVPDGQALNGGGKPALPGGKKESSESIDEAAMREFHEETAIDITSVSGTKHQFTNSYGAGYFRVSEDKLVAMCAQITKPNLVEALAAVEKR